MKYISHFDAIDWVLASILLLCAIALVWVIFFSDNDSGDDDGDSSIHSMNTTISTMNSVVSNSSFF